MPKGDEKRWDKILAECKQVLDDFPYNLFDKYYTLKEPEIPQHYYL